MPKWISFEGEWFPATEEVALRNNSKVAIKNPTSDEMIEPGKPFIYKGPDRAALLELHEQKADKLGQNFRETPEFVELWRGKHYKSEKEYLKVKGYDSKKAKERFEEEKNKVNLHELPAKVQAIQKLGGGTDFVGSGQDKLGGFGDAR